MVENSLMEKKRIPWDVVLTRSGMEEKTLRAALISKKIKPTRISMWKRADRGMPTGYVDIVANIANKSADEIMGREKLPSSQRYDSTKESPLNETKVLQDLAVIEAAEPEEATLIKAQISAMAARINRQKNERSREKYPPITPDTEDKKHKSA